VKTPLNSIPAFFIGELKIREKRGKSQINSINKLQWERKAHVTYQLE